MSRWLLRLLAVVLTATLAVEGWYLLRPADSQPTAGRPVLTGSLAQGTAVASAASSAAAILSYGFEDFDAQVEDATTRMTPEFASDFRASTEAARDRFAEQRITQQVRVVGSAVVSASAEQVQALLFLDEYVARAGSGTRVTPYRAVVTVVRVDGRWLVSDIRTV